MDNMKEKIESVITLIMEVTTLFYQNKTQEAYIALDSTLLALNQVVDLIFANKNAFPEFDEQKFVGLLTEALEALENKDTSLFADLMQYEILEILEMVRTNLS